MSDLTDFFNTIRSWIDRQDASDALITSWLRIAEERMNNDLRTDFMISRQSANFLDNCDPLPVDWLETIYVRYVLMTDSQFPPQANGLPLEVVSIDEYWKRQDKNNPNYNNPYYTHIGRLLFVGPPVDTTNGTQFEVGYYAMVPPWTDTAPLLYNRSPSLYLYLTLQASAPWLMEDDRAVAWGQVATGVLNDLNTAHKQAKYSGSPMKLRIRSFG